MPREKTYDYKLQLHLTQHTKALLKATGKQRGRPMADLIREYVDAGLARDVVRLGIHLNNEETSVE
jgi:hypothetical protein